MEEPISAQKEPYILELERGVYLWCACGKSQNQPFCDSSHKGSEFLPVKVKIPEKQEVYLCGCKRTGTKPFCDDTHLTLQ
jgi:CDGSH-type Zn-finger protein